MIEKLKRFCLLALTISLFFLECSAALAGSARSRHLELPFWGEIQKQLAENGDRDSFTLPGALSLKMTDWAASELFQTAFGGQLVRELLKCNETLVYEHLGVSLRGAKSLVDTICQPTSTKASPWIRADPRADIRKVDTLPAARNRVFRFVVLKQEKHLAVDSFTQLLDRSTTVFIPRNLNEGEFAFYLLQTLAHETAIYFDGKSNLNEDFIRSSAVYAGLNFLTPQGQEPHSMNAILTSLQNPVLKHIFSYIRAFKVEDKWLSQLKTRLESESPQLAADNLVPQLEFASQSCQLQCLEDYINSQVTEIAYYSLPLLVYSNYWSNKVDKLVQQPLGDNDRKALQILISARKKYLRSSDPNHIFFRQAAIAFMDTEIQELARQSHYVFINVLIPEDFSTILSVDVKTTEMADSDRLLNWVNRPLLSNVGIESSFGPRPRIRTGIGLPWLDEFDFDTDELKAPTPPSDGSGSQEVTDDGRQ